MAQVNIIKAIRFIKQQMDQSPSFTKTAIIITGILVAIIQAGFYETGQH